MEWTSGGVEEWSGVEWRTWGLCGVLLLLLLLVVVVVGIGDAFAGGVVLSNPPFPAAA